MKIAAPAGRNNLAIVSPLFRRSAADVSIMASTHGSRRGLQIFRRSAAEDQRQSHLKMEETQPGHTKFFAQTLEEEIVEGAFVHFLFHVASIRL